MSHANDNQEDNPEDLAAIANVDDHTTLARHNEPVFTNELNSISKTTEEKDFERRNPAHAKSYLEDTPEDPASGANLDDTTLATHNEPVFSDGPNSVFQKDRGRTWRGKKSNPS